MTARISGMSFDVNVGGIEIHINTVSLDISDETSVAKTRGIPDGTIDGAISAEGEIEVDSRNFNLLGEAASQAGSWRGLPPMDFLFFADTGDERIDVKAFGCKLLLSNLLNIDSKGGELAMHKLKYLVSSPDFVHINGTRVLSEHDVRGLMG
ncbi:DUF2597 domain-containing protein [Edwardsiella ictaluri]|uniref:Phage protein n=1 Tax=Edwardsiella ictaluri (strain 93-146) TaxID=634503 RepID=C5BH06_EDWI9|nr:phage protein [Edwardsiella ictaluri]ACR69437.1 hypothetical protein NT01EI_2263 [Edwardsiella ictaluri 93-146]AVZ83547.1 DUF2597 domain-containing protein [Edwardsiella ictaluri]EKS7764161.1 DUF2597 family protein [Edwardsiella ictaluri]EKS7771020.1 DUF2597 family protein [Edwardsiella ictaluri]EKS7774112.1 DUF2597 family protein [Edwardsiella ictaluri]